jgi:hypothetical protein
MSDVPVERSDAELEAWYQEWKAEREHRALQLRRDARAVFAAMEGWQRITSPEAWQETCDRAGQDYRSGRFSIEQLGASRHLDPTLMATLWGLRQQLVAEGGKTAAESMLADVAVTSYYNSVRIQRWIGDLAIAIEREFFGEDGPSARFKAQSGRVDGLVVEAQLERLAEELLPLQERANRMLVRNLKALAELRRGPAPSVAIGQAGQVNLGHGAQQVTLAHDADRQHDAVRPSRRRRGATKPNDDSLK